MKYPTRKQLRHLKKQGWKLAANKLAWQSPHDRYYYSPQAAVLREERHERNLSAR